MEIAGNSLRGKVFAKIEQDIINGRYMSGDSLVEGKLSEELGVSRTPVREALGQLELEGLVTLVPNKGAIVKGISNKDIEDIYTIRIMIEGLAARWAAESITDEELKELRDAVLLEEFYTQKNEESHLLDSDSQFHEIIFKASKSRPLMRVLISFHNYISSARSLSLKTPGRPENALNEHKAILEAIESQNADMAELLMNKHIMNAKENVKKTLSVKE
jgi:DNA-binding GntR family transcriptional regulator